MNKYIETILKTRKITDYLSSKGIEHVRSNPGKLWYKCPIHRGDNTPSFCVYTDSLLENYYCFGCHSGGTIVQLYMDLEETSFRKALEDLGEGISFDTAFDLKSYINELKDDNLFKSIFDTIDEISFRMYRACYDAIALCDFSPSETDFYENVYQKIDELYNSRDIDTLRALETRLMEVYIPQRTSNYLDNKELEKVQANG